MWFCKYDDFLLKFRLAFEIAAIMAFFKYQYFCLPWVFLSVLRVDSLTEQTVFIFSIRRGNSQSENFQIMLLGQTDNLNV